MKRLALAALLLLAACSHPRYVRFPASTVDTLRMYIEQPATLKVYDSAGTKWLLVEPLDSLKALRAIPIKPLNHANECPPWC